MLREAHGFDCRTIVVADNCSDDTAQFARAQGAEVWERHAPELRGKGAALAWAFARAAGIGYDLALILDADSELQPGFFHAIAAAYHQALMEQRPAVVLQGRYEFSPAHGGEHWFDSLTIASKAAENSFSARPRTALGLVNLIQGNGFLISRSALAQVPFAANSVVEDAEYAIALALAGVPVRLVEAACVVSRMTARVQDAAPQRLRWATGMFQLIGRSVPRLLAGAARERRLKLAEAALMLLFTSRVLLIYLTAAALLLLAVAQGAAAYLSAAMLAVSIALQFAYLMLVLRKAGSRAYALRPLLLTPAYLAFVGFAQALGVLGLRRKQWSRTVR